MRFHQRYQIWHAFVDSESMARSFSPGKGV
jgi:hypothetical protein